MYVYKGGQDVFGGVLCQFNAISCRLKFYSDAVFGSLFGGKFLSKFKEFPLKSQETHW